MNAPSVEVIDVTANLRIRIEYDQDAESPAAWDNVGQITYKKGGRELLGTEPVDTDRFFEIGRGIDSGELLGMPVYAYVHSGSTIATHPFSCQWDSGQSGYVYCTKEKAIAEFGKKALTKKVREQALRYLQGEVETFDQYLRGDVYGFVIERPDGKQLDSCWGFYGQECCVEEAKSVAAYLVKSDIEEAAEAAEMAARDIATV